MQFDPSSIERVFKEERGRVLATLIRVLGDLDRAEDALANALEAAIEGWPRDGAPDNPRAWLIRTARNKAIDEIRRRALAQRKHAELVTDADDAMVPSPDDREDPSVGDDRLSLIFTCCHPSLGVEAQVALTLRTLGGLSTEEIARAFLVPVPTMAARLVRAKQKIKTAGIPYRVPDEEDLPERVEAVAAVVYLIFNEGYSATSGDALVRRELGAEAIRLGRLLVDLVPSHRGPKGLLALMLLHDSRRDARVDAHGDLVLLEEQDRSRWDQEQIREGLALVETALRAGPPDAYAIQAAIAAIHARATVAEATDWAQIAALYQRLLLQNPSPVVMLNHAVAVAMSDGPEAGLRLLEHIDARGELAGYPLFPATRADLLRRLGRRTEAAVAYREALGLVENEAQRRFLKRRLDELATET
ncbi:MAG TPA: RNA polymerase sigma factor [Polyangiaceae bacterium]|jgi:RNA polymerase sigma-70 factor (ECF subfamily)|nr:RNA polymerase sigma factor [Polyangiaceae bacterium]